jgi:thymidylate kinase
MIFILDAEPVILFKRKKELALDELNRQVIKYRKIGQTYKNSYIIDATQSIDKVTEDVTKQILLYKAKQTGRLMGLKLDENGMPL